MGPDEDPMYLKLKMKAYNFGAFGEDLTLNRFDGYACTGTSTEIDDDIDVWRHWN